VLPSTRGLWVEIETNINFLLLITGWTVVQALY